MKKLLFTNLIFLLSLMTFAQKTVDAKEIIEKINKGQSITYSDVTIKGDLLFTNLDDFKKEKNGKEYKFVFSVKSDISFTNCIFEGKVEAYRYDEHERTLYDVDFYGNVVFNNCTFNKDAHFKYSLFEKKSEFNNSTFLEEALFKYSTFETFANFSKTNFKDIAVFKYSKFESNADFSNCVFEEESEFKYAKFENKVTFKYAVFKDDVTFKYVDFPEIDFSNIVFYDDADFKYAKFPEGVDFSETKFKRYADFKYAKFAAINIKGTKFEGSTDFKYTKVDGQDFIQVLLNNR